MKKFTLALLAASLAVTTGCAASAASPIPTTSPTYRSTPITTSNADAEYDAWLAREGWTPAEADEVVNGILSTYPEAPTDWLTCALTVVVEGWYPEDLIELAGDNPQLAGRLLYIEHVEPVCG